MKLYISGPISGVEVTASATFASTAAILSKHGYATINPFDVPAICPLGIGDSHGSDMEGLPNTHEFECWLRGDLAVMLYCDGLAMLPGWESSRGARLEHFVALQVGLRVQSCENWVLQA